MKKKLKNCRSKNFFVEPKRNYTAAYSYSGGRNAADFTEDRLPKKKKGVLNIVRRLILQK